MKKKLVAVKSIQGTIDVLNFEENEVIRLNDEYWEIISKPVTVEFEIIKSEEDQRKNISRLEDEITGLQLKLERLLREVNT